MDYFLLGIAITLFSGIISQIAGGGGAMITIPILIFFGIPPHVAIASNKAASFGTIGAVYRYTKAKKIHWNWILPLSIIGVLAGYAGAKITLAVNEQTVKMLLSIFMLSMLPLMLLTKTWGTKHHDTSNRKRGLGVFLYTLVSAIQAAFSAGLGLMMTYLLVTFWGWTLIEANATRRIPHMIMSLIVFVTFIFAGVVYPLLSLGIFIGHFVGGYIGAHIAIKKGNEFVKIFFTLLIVVSAVKLLI